MPNVGTLMRSGVIAACLAIAAPVMRIVDAQPSGAPAAAVAPPRIFVAPNVLVSRDGEVPHYETHIAAHPVDPRRLLGAAITYASLGAAGASKAYWSDDGGWSWQDVEFPELMKHTGGDPQTAFTVHGTAIFISHRFVSDERGRRLGASVLVYRSTDGGKGWSEPADLGYSYDRPIITVDRSSGRFANRLYMVVMYRGVAPYVVGVFRSEDDGRTWIGPVDAITSEPGYGLNGSQPLVLSDVTLFVPIRRFAVGDSLRERQTAAHNVFVTSTDGGVTFSAPRPLPRHVIGDAATRRQERAAGGMVQLTSPVFAVDDGWTNPTHRDRIYAVWTDARFGRPRLLLSYSTDKGATWTEPTTVSRDAPDASLQFQPAVEVNRDGTVGVMWFDTRNAPGNRKYDVYFTASVDGGVSFLPAVRVSSESSTPAGFGNLQPAFFGLDRNDQRIRASITSQFSYRPGGGDYIGLASGAGGTFHLFWPDSRSGTALVYASRVDVSRLGIQLRLAGRAGAANRSVVTSSVLRGAPVSRDVTGRVTLVLDVGRYDTTTKEIILPVRLKNVSADTLFAPLGITITKLEDPASRDNQLSISQIANAANGNHGAGATFDYSRTLRDLEGLPPGAVTEPVNWRIRVRAPMQTDFLFIEAKIEGRVR